MPRGVPKAPLIDRFLNRVDKNGPTLKEELGACWTWTGGKGATGYGELRPHIWDESYAHRWAFKHYNGAIPEGHDIRHKCDNRACVNPDHLETGTRAANNQDKKERHPKPNNRKFDAGQVEQIKALRAEGKLYKELAEQFGCNRRTIERMCLGTYY